MDRLVRSAAGLLSAIAMVAAGGCATAPPDPGAPGAVNEVRQSIQVTPHEAGTSILQPSGFTPGNHGADDPSIEATCTASNDRGSWTIAAPGRLEIVPSRAPLKVTCQREGYRDSSVELKCITPRTRGAAGGAWGVLQIFAMTGPFAVVAVPVAGLVLAVTAGATAAGAGAGAALASGPDADVCSYAIENSLQVWMLPAR